MTLRKALPAALCAICLTLALFTPAAAQEKLPLDLRDHWSAPYVITLLESGNVSGYPDGRFRPDQPLTRQEAVSLLYRLLPASAYPDAATLAGVALYPDVTEAWSQDMIRALMALGVLDNEASFRPTEPMTRGDMARYTAKVLARMDTLSADREAPQTPAGSPAAAPEPAETKPASSSGPDGGEKPSEPGGNQRKAEMPKEGQSSSPAQDASRPSPTAPQTGTDAESQEATVSGGQTEDPDQTPVEAGTGGQDGVPLGEETPVPPQQDPAGGETPTAAPETAGAPAAEAASNGGKVTLEQVRQELAGGAPLAFADSAGSDGGLYVQFLSRRGVITGNDTGTYQPQDSLTRGQAAAMLFRAAGLPLTATTFDPLPAYRVIEVPYLSQVYPVYAPVGCEATSLLMGLKGKGYAQELDLRTFLDNLPRTSSDPAKGFVGSPYVADPTKKTRTTIYPAKLAEYGSQFGNVIDISGASLSKIQREVLSGNPVVVYMTLYWETPFYRWYDIEGQQQRLLSNNHALLLCGYDASANAYYVADPYNIKNRTQEYYYWVAGDTFEPLYLERCQAVTISD